MRNQHEGSRKPATIKDVANRAGVSIATASRVLSNHGYSSEKSCSLVRKAALDLGYKPNELAQKLRSKQTKTIGLMITDIINPFYAFLAEGVLNCAIALGYHVITCATDEDDALERDYLDLLMRQRAAGIIAVPTGNNLKEWRQAIDMGIKVVLVDREVKGLFDVDLILVDNEIGAYEITNYLISLGHRRIGLINGPLSTTTGHGRFEGYCRALKEAGITPDMALVENVGFKSENGAEAARRLLTREAIPTAIFAANNVLAEATIFVLRELEINIPDDISLAVFDDVPWASLSNPPITTVSQPMILIGKLGMEQVDKLLKAGDPQLKLPRQKIVLSPELIIRESCSSPHNTFE